ncbi:MAG: MBL fold metallo-hydrolase [Promethearchaeia archaeon]
MGKITIYDGADTIGGNKIYYEENGKGIFLDFGLNFKKMNEFYQEFLSLRANRGIYDYIKMNLAPQLQIYRESLIPEDLKTEYLKYRKLNVEAVLLTHAHQDHFGLIGLLDRRIPIIASPITIAFLKGILDCSNSKMNLEAAYCSKKEYFKNDERRIQSIRYQKLKRNFYCIDKVQDELKEYYNILFSNRNKFVDSDDFIVEPLIENSFSFNIQGHNIDHSIYGATAYIVEGSTKIAYTGDFRLHGKNRDKTEEFIQKAQDASVLIIEGTQAGREDINESEDIVYENCLKVIEDNKGLVVADFSARNFERLELFGEIAKKTSRQLVITAKDWFLLKILEKADSIDRTNGYRIFNELKISYGGWEKEIIKNYEEQYIDPFEIAESPENYILCFSLYDIKHLLDIKIKGGTYIYSSSEAFEDEQEFDFMRLSNWLKFLSFDIIGFKEGNQGRIEFEKGFHASGHATKNDLIKTIEKIDPDIIIPIHTENPEWFSENFDNVKLIKNGDSLII